MTKQNEQIIDFLKTNPNFFNEHPDVLESMNLPGEKTSGGVVDFQTRMLDKLKRDKSRAQSIHKEMIENAVANMGNQSRIHTAILVAMEAESFEEFIEVVTQDLPPMLNVDTINIVIESTSKEIPFISNAGIRFAKAGLVTKWLNTGDALLQSNITGSDEIYGPGAGQVRSQALIRFEISENTPLGIIAFGSRDPELFQPDMAVDQVGFLAQVIERLFRIWLGIQS